MSDRLSFLRTKQNQNQNTKTRACGHSTLVYHPSSHAVVGPTPPLRVASFNHYGKAASNMLSKNACSIDFHTKQSGFMTSAMHFFPAVPAVALNFAGMSSRGITGQECEMWKAYLSISRCGYVRFL